MRVLLTGGSGDLGSLLARRLKAQGDTPVIFDLRAPIEPHEFIEGSITDAPALVKALRGIDMVAHIAALHGIHEPTHSAQQFHDINVQGTANALEAAAANSIKKFVFISSTSVRDEKGVYGRSKIAGEKMVRAFAAAHDMDTIILRPRAFIPPWNKSAYENYIQWAQWFWKGAVHVADVAQATLRAVNYLKANTPGAGLPALTIDGAYDYTQSDLDGWNGQTFARVYGEKYQALALRHSLDPTIKPFVLDTSKTHEILGYDPQYSLRDLLSELETYGAAGPPSPFEKPAPSAPQALRK